jgi:hypothetical protein
LLGWIYGGAGADGAWFELIVAAARAGSPVCGMRLASIHVMLATPIVEWLAMRKGVVLAVFVVALVATWLTYSKITHARREASYRVAIASFKRDLRIGMDRTEVKNYLNSHSIICNTSAIQSGTVEATEIHAKSR